MLYIIFLLLGVLVGIWIGQSEHKKNLGMIQNLCIILAGYMKSNNKDRIVIEKRTDESWHYLNVDHVGENYIVKIERD